MTIPEMLDAANNEIQAAKSEICAPVDNRFIDALEMLHAVLSHLYFGQKESPKQTQCEDCDGFGHMEVTHGMAIDAGNPSLSGQLITCGKCSGDGWIVTP